MKNQSASMRDIKMILQKNDLLISSIRRTRFGPYSVGTLKPGHFAETDIDQRIKTFLFHYKKQQLKAKQEEMAKKWEEISAGQTPQFNLLEANRQIIEEKALPPRRSANKLEGKRR